LVPADAAREAALSDPASKRLSEVCCGSIAHLRTRANDSLNKNNDFSQRPVRRPPLAEDFIAEVQAAGPPRRMIARYIRPARPGRLKTAKAG
jgi:hypothetical protein